MPLHAIVAALALATMPQSVPVPSASPSAATAAATLMLPPGTSLKLRVDKEIASKNTNVGDTFTLSLADDVMLGTAIAIPKGAQAIAVVSERSGRGAFGRSAKMRIQFHSIAYNGRDYALKGDGRKAGKGNTAAVIGSFLLFGPFAGAISGTSARFKAGQILDATTADPIPIVAR